MSADSIHSTNHCSDAAGLWPFDGPVMAAVDPFAADANAVLHDALELAQALGRRLFLLHVIEPMAQVHLLLPTMPDIEEKQHELAESKLRAWMSGHAPDAELLMVVGRAWSEITRVAREQSACLLLLGRGEDDEGLGAVFGSTCERVVRHAHCPVLVLARGGRPLASCGGSVMLCTDRSDSSVASFSSAVAYARLRQAPLLLVCAEDPLALPGQHEYEIFQEEIDAKREAHESALREFRAHHLPAEVEVETRVIEGAPHRALCRLAIRRHARLMVLANHGRSAWQRALIGSTTERVVRQAACPVLVVPCRDQGIEVAD
jgi:nucleotide-binding universal stress UspA family protein